MINYAIIRFGRLRRLRKARDASRKRIPRLALDIYYQAKIAQNEFAAKAGELLKKVREKKEKNR